MTEQQTPASVVERPWTPGCTELLKSIADDANFADWMTNPTMPEFLRSAAAKIESLSAEREVLREALEKIAAGYALCDGFDDAQVIATDALSTQGESRQTGWIEWHGGENPAPGKRVDVRWRDGEVSTDEPSRDWCWKPTDGDDTIIAYRVVTPPAPTPADGGGE